MEQLPYSTLVPGEVALYMLIFITFLVVDYLKEKWGLHFDISDTNRDGVIDTTDVDLSVATMTHNLTAREVSIARKQHQLDGPCQLTRTALFSLQ